MHILEQYTVLIPIDDGAGDSRESRELGPFYDRDLALLVARGRGINGTCASIRTKYWVTGDDDAMGYMFTSPPTMSAIEEEHPIAATLGRVKPEDVAAILKAFGSR